MRRQAAAVLCGLAVAVGAPLVAQAAAPSKITYSGLTVSPAIESLELKAGQTSVTFETDVSNRSSTPITVETSLLDFTALNINGGVSFLRSSSTNVHGLAQYLVPAPTRFSLAPGAGQKVTLTVPDTSRLAAGGHYGAVIYQAVPSAGSGSNKVTANEEVSQLVFLTTATGGITAVNLQTPDIAGFTTHLPDNINLVFTNTGNEQTAPRGIIHLKNSAGKEVARSIINTDSGLILPGTERLYQIPLNPPKNMFMPAVYHLQIDSQASGSAPISTYKKTIVYVSTAFLLVSLGVLIVLVMGLHWLLRRRTIRRRSYRG